MSVQFYRWCRDARRPCSQESDSENWKMDRQSRHQIRDDDASTEGSCRRSVEFIGSPFPQSRVVVGVYCSKCIVFIAFPMIIHGLSSVKPRFPWKSCNIESTLYLYLLYIFPLDTTFFQFILPYPVNPRLQCSITSEAWVTYWSKRFNIKWRAGREENTPILICTRGRGMFRE